MKRINGTITLSYVEEDNMQRVIFRVIPLCTREGVSFCDDTNTFPDVSSLRVVPDKREQSTFKERMRSMGSLCVIELVTGEGKELNKVRQNRNYDPSQGEHNQFAIYSDVIQEFSSQAVFEVISWPDSTVPPFHADNLLTQMLLLQCNKVLYGPVSREELPTISLEKIKPFGNDHFLLQTIELSGFGKRSIYWNPEDTINWRQRRGSLRKKAERETKSAMENSQASASMQSSIASKNKEMITPSEEDSVNADHQHLHVQSTGLSVDHFSQNHRQNTMVEEALPIGTHLDILDSTMPFEEQISRISQPLSQRANRLTALEEAMQNTSPNSSVHFNGTPITTDTAWKANTISQPEPLHHVVELQLRQKDENKSQSKVYTPNNPIENLQMAVDKAWQDTQTRQQALDLLLGNEGFMNTLLEAMRTRHYDMRAVAAAYEQLDEIEAERLSVLMKLELAKTSEREYREKAIAATVQKKKEELSKLTLQIQKLRAEKEKLEELFQTLGEGSLSRVEETVNRNFSALGGLTYDSICLMPVMGTHFELEEMLSCACTRLNQSGFGISEDDCLALLVAFSLFPCICLLGEDSADSVLFAQTFLASLHLQSVSAIVEENTALGVANLFSYGSHCTPTVSIQPIGSGILSISGHKTIFVADQPTAVDGSGEALQPYPVIAVPTQQMRSVDDCTICLKAPAALSSFLILQEEKQPLQYEGEKWFEEMKLKVAGVNCTLPDAVVLCMRRFVEVISKRINGGILAAIDLAMLQWVLPLLIKRDIRRDDMLSILCYLPRSLSVVEQG